MSVEPPFPELDELLSIIGETGTRMCEIEASEGAAGNISICIGWGIDPRRKFPIEEPYRLPQSVPGLANRVVIVTGSGRRLREIEKDPVANLGVVRIGSDGETGTIYTSPKKLFSKPTSEFNSHLAIHEHQVMQSGTNFNAIVHAQPTHLTFLSHIPAYQDERTFNKSVLRWQPELIVQIPEGIGLIPFHVPGSESLMRSTLSSLEKHRIVVWAKHGVMARSSTSLKRAADTIEYAETGAKYEFMNIQAGSKALGLSEEEIQSICQAFNVTQSIF